MTRNRRAFDTAFKLKVVQMIREQGLSVGQVCRDRDSVSNATAHSPSWAGDSRTRLFQSDDRLRRVDVVSGRERDVPLDLRYTLQGYRRACRPRLRRHAR